jgi:FKBP-type peptidyl-prolyl cis-trans isomerase
MSARTPLLASTIAACALALGTASAAVADTKPAPAPVNSPSYSAGLQFGDGMHRAGITDELDLDAFMRGIKDGLAGKTVAPEDRERLNKFFSELRNKLIDRNHAAAKEFLDKNHTAAGVVTTASGLQYKVVEPGNSAAASPGPTDQVTVQYRGRLLDGTEFDSTYSRGTPATFLVNGVIPGWQEALVLMKPGAKWQLFVPPQLAYDANSRPPIPPGSLLVFDVELVSVGAAKP